MKSVVLPFLELVMQFDRTGNSYNWKLVLMKFKLETRIDEIQTGQKINCEAMQVISDSIVHITKAISQLREDVEEKQVNNQTENYSNPIQELLHNHNTNEIINEANETNISEVSNSNGKNETSTNKIDNADASNTPNLIERVAPHLNDPNGKYRQIKMIRLRNIWCHAPSCARKDNV